MLINHPTLGESEIRGPYPKDPKPGKRPYYQVEWEEDGKRMQKHAPFKLRNKEEVAQWFVKEYKPDPKPAIPEKKTIISLFDWWKTHPTIAARPGIIKTIGVLKTHILSHRIATIDLETEFKGSDVPDFHRSIKNTQKNIPAAPQSIYNVSEVAKIFIRDCIREGKLNERTINWFETKAFGKVRENTGKERTNRWGSEVITIEAEDMRKLLSSKDYPQERRIKYVLAFATGMRAGELSGLSWDKVDLINGNIDIIQQLSEYYRQSKEIENPFPAPKKKSYRPGLPLHSYAIEELKKWKEQGWKEFVGREPKPSDPVFPNPSGCFYNPSWIAVLFRDDLQKAGISPRFRLINGKEVDLTLHATRRTFRSLLAYAGVSDSVVKLLLGHKNSSVTDLSYLRTKLKEPIYREAIEKLPLRPQ